MPSSASLRSYPWLFFLSFFFTCAFIFYEVRDRYDPLRTSQVADDALQNPLGVILSHDGCYLNNNSSSSDSSHALRLGVSCSLTYITSRRRRCHRHPLLYGPVIKESAMARHSVARVLVSWRFASTGRTLAALKTTGSKDSSSTSSSSASAVTPNRLPRQQWRHVTMGREEIGIVTYTVVLCTLYYITYIYITLYNIYNIILHYIIISNQLQIS